jgi:hypothetical protein
MRYPCLFNFSTSGVGGGLKRLQEYSRWFNERGGAAFIIQESCNGMADLFPANRYFIVQQSNIQRIFDDASYINGIKDEIGYLQLYYAYGIPVYRSIARVNWFHLSNVMPFNFWRFRLPLIDYFKQPLLAWRYHRNLANADIVSAESQASLGFLRTGPCKSFVSVNGSDDELAYAAQPAIVSPRPSAVVVGTYSYKAIADAYRVFLHLKTVEPSLTLTIVGVIETIPKMVREGPDVACTGVLPRPEVVRLLRQATYYISTTRLENSYNAASEGVFLARQSLISDILPHRELLSDQRFELVRVPSVRNALIKIERSQASTLKLKTWDQVIREMLGRAQILVE